jgi:hypothetical protein
MNLAMAGVMHPKTSCASIIWNWLSCNLGDWMTIIVSLSTTDNTSIDSWRKQLAQACAVCSPFLRSKRATAIFANDCSPQEVRLKTADFQTVYVGEDDDMV